MKRRAGIISLQTSTLGRVDCKGSFAYNLGKPMREELVGSDGIHGFKETPQAAFIEGEITDSAGLSLADLVTIEADTLTLQLAVGPNGPAKMIVLKDAAFAGEGTGNSEEGNIGVRFVSSDEAEEIVP